MLLDPEPDDEKSALKTCLTCHFRHDGPMVGSRRRERHLCPVDPITQKVFVCRKWETCPTGWRTGHPNVDSKPQTVEAIEKKIKKLEKVVIKKQDEERKDAKKKYQLHSPILFKTELQDLCLSKEPPPQAFEKIMLSYKERNKENVSFFPTLF